MDFLRKESKKESAESQDPEQDSGTPLEEKLVMVVEQLVHLYIKHSGDIRTVHSSLLDKGWKETRTAGKFYSVSISRSYIVFCEPRILEYYRTGNGDTPAPVWAKGKAQGEYVRLPREKWESVLKKLDSTER